MSRRNLTPEQRQRSEERKTKFAAIVKQVADMPEEERNALAARIQVTNCDGHALSPRNQLLIALQIGTHCTIVGGFRQWIKQGRCVMKGQHGATILFPRTFGDKNGPENATAASEQAAAAESSNGKKSPVRFLSGTVFDISQTAEIDGETGQPKEEEPAAVTLTEEEELTTQAEPPKCETFTPGHYAPKLCRTCKKTEREHLPTIWDTDAPEPGKQYLITAPTPTQRAAFNAKKEKRSMMNQPPPGGWTDADRVPDHMRKRPATPQVPALNGMSPLALPPSPALASNDDGQAAFQWELLPPAKEGENAQ